MGFCARLAIAEGSINMLIRFDKVPTEVSNINNILKSLDPQR